MSVAVNEFLSVLSKPMVVFGFAGQALFFSRFLVQWITSEREGKSTVPPVFWLLSFGGGCMMLVYAIWRRDLIFTVGQATGLLVYARNLMLIWRHRTR